MLIFTVVLSEVDQGCSGLSRRTAGQRRRVSDAAPRVSHRSV